jgi:hypothetical protein
MRYFVTSLLLLILVYFAQAQTTSEITIYNAKDHIGRQGTVCDKIINIKTPSSEKKPIYIDFGGVYPDNIFSAVIFPSDIPKFSYNPVEVLKDKNVCITGKISEYKGKPQIVINETVQVAIQD